MKKKGVSEIVLSREDADVIRRARRILSKLQKAMSANNAIINEEYADAACRTEKSGDWKAETREYRRLNDLQLGNICRLAKAGIREYGTDDDRTMLELTTECAK